jgi:hypothetical protein
MNKKIVGNFYGYSVPMLIASQIEIYAPLSEWNVYNRAYEVRLYCVVDDITVAIEWEGYTSEIPSRHGYEVSASKDGGRLSSTVMVDDSVGLYAAILHAVGMVNF